MSIGTKRINRGTTPAPQFFLALALLLTVIAIGGVSIANWGWSPAIVNSLASQAPSVQQAAPQSVPTPWYRSPWAITAYALGSVGIIFLLARHRTATLERERENLEGLVHQRTEEVRTQKQTLETYNRELLRTNETLRQTVEEKSKLLGTAAHDLKNPLFGIRALSEIVLESDDLPPKHERKLTLIRESADETLTLIDNLLASAANSARSEIDTRNIDVAALTQWVVRSFEPQAQRKEQSLLCSVSEGNCVVWGDKRKLREAIGNLVSNALKYSPPGEAVEVAIGRRDNTVQVAVSDDGPGLSASDLERMFAPFQRLSAEPTGGEGSSGLGLYIVKQIADLHDGIIDVETALGDGSTFTLILPATSPDTAPTPETDPADLGVEMEVSNA